MCENCKLLLNALNAEREHSKKLMGKFDEAIELADWAMEKLKERI